jgi:hypothetical protein
LWALRCYWPIARTPALLAWLGQEEQPQRGVGHVDASQQANTESLRGKADPADASRRDWAPVQVRTLDEKKRIASAPSQCPDLTPETTGEH